MNNIGIVDLYDKNSIKNVLHSSGFFYMPYDEVDKNLIRDLFDHSKELFCTNEEIKRKYFSGKNGIGYSPLNTFKMDHSKIDMKESFTYRQNEMENNELYDKAVDKLSTYAKTIFCRILESLNLDPKDYSTGMKDSFNTLSLIHYPPIKSVPDNNLYGISEHTDWGFVTLLSTNENGLQVKINDEWIYIPVTPHQTKVWSFYNYINYRSVSDRLPFS